MREDGFESGSRKQASCLLRSTRTRRFEGSMAKISQGASAIGLSWRLPTCREQKRNLKTKRRMQADFSRSHLDFGDVSWHCFCVGEGS